MNNNVFPNFKNKNKTFLCQPVHQTIFTEYDILKNVSSILYNGIGLRKG